MPVQFLDRLMAICWNVGDGCTLPWLNSDVAFSNTSKINTAGGPSSNTTAPLMANDSGISSVWNRRPVENIVALVDAVHELG